MVGPHGLDCSDNIYGYMVYVFQGLFFLNEFLVWIYQGFLVLASMVHG